MLDKFKQIAKLKALQDEAKKERFTVELNGVTITVSGSFNVEEVILNNELSENELAETIKNCFNQAIFKAQQGMAQKMQSMNLGL